MEKIDVKNITRNGIKFHFTKIENLQNIIENGLVAKKGSASSLVNEEYNRVYLSDGIKGMIEMKNSFIYTFSNLTKEEISEDYKKYFNNFNKDITKKDLYDAMINRFKNEVYFLVDAKEGIDYNLEDAYGYSNNDIKCKIDHNIKPDKLKLITTEKGNTAFDVLEYYYGLYLDLFKDNIELGKSFNSDFCSLMDYANTGIINEYDLNIEKSR